jgi:hypothetical protein
MKIINHKRKKSRKTLEDGRTSHAHGSAESDCLKQSVFPMQPLSKVHDILHQDRKVHPNVHIEAQKTLNSQSNPKQKEQCWHHNT